MTTSLRVPTMTVEQSRFLSNTLPTWISTVESDAPDSERDKHLAMLRSIAAAVDATVEEFEGYEPMTVLVSDLRPSDILVGDSGALVRITGEIESSGVVFGAQSIEVEVGTIYLDPDEEQEVLRFVGAQ